MTSPLIDNSKPPRHPKPGSLKTSSSASTPSKAKVAAKPQREPGRALSKKRGVNFVEVYGLDRIARIRQAKTGLPALAVSATARSMNVPDQRVLDILKYPKATIARKIAAGGRLTLDESERLLGLQMLIGQVEVMVHSLGRGEGFDAPTWVDHFLATPCAALGGVKPEEFMPLSEGRQLIADIVSRMGAGNYS